VGTHPMTAPTPLRVLLVAQQPADAELVLHELRRARFAPQASRVQTAEELVRALDAAPEVVIADHAVPGCDALTTLQLILDRGDETPVIVVSDATSEAACVETLRRGAADYLLKDRLARLGPAVGRALASRRLAEERREAERRSRAHRRLFQATFDHGPAGMAVSTPKRRLIEANAALCRTVGRSRGSLLELPFDELTHPDDRPAVQAYVAEVLRGNESERPIEARLVHAAGHPVWTQLLTSPVVGNDGRMRYLIHHVQDITERHEAETTRRNAQSVLRRQAAALTRTNEKLQKLDLLKNDFVASVSHELRTPLTCVLGYTELLIRGKVGALADPQRRIVDVIDQCGRTLHALIEDLLTVSSIDAGAFRLVKQSVQVGALVDAVRLALAPALGAPQLRLVVDIEPGLPDLQADPRQLERALTNLITNAVKFSPRGGTITVSARPVDDDVVVSVADTGIGIPREELERMFVRFFRASTAQEHEIQGTGLGLAIVKTIVEHHGGWIRLDSDVGAGTTVSFGLPVAGTPGSSPD